MSFVKAERKKTKLRLSIQGISGSGKTYSALKLATGMGGPIAVIDTERGSSSLYSDDFNFDICQIEPPFSPDKYIKSVKEAEKAGYNVLIIDSLSHAWAGDGGILDLHTKKTAASAKGNSFTAWKDITPLQNRLIETILQSKLHVIVCMRCKTHYDIVKGEKGESKPIKHGLAPIQRAEMEYEFDCVFELSQNNYANSTKDRTKLFVGKDFIITEQTGIELLEWLNTGKPDYSKIADGPASEEQLFEFYELINFCAINENTQNEWLKIAKVSRFEDLSSRAIAKFINALYKKQEELQKDQIILNEDAA